MKFNQYVEAKEAAETQEIDQIFNQAATDIQTLFGQLYKGTADMVQNYEKATLPDELVASIIKDLGRVAQKVKGSSKKNKMTDPRGPGQPVENVTIDAFIKDITQMINEAQPSIVQDMGSHGVGPGGKKAYDFRSTLTNTYRLVMDRMGQLKDTVLKHLGLLSSMNKRIGGIRNTQGNIRNRLDTMGQQLSNPAQPFAGNEADRAQDSMIALGDASRQLGGLTLVAQDGTEIPVNPRSEMWKKMILKHGQQHKIFTLTTKDGRKEQVNMGNPEQVHTVLDTLGFKSTSDFVPEPKRKARAIGLKGPDGRVIKDQ